LFFRAICRTLVAMKARLRSSMGGSDSCLIFDQNFDNGFNPAMLVYRN